MKDTTGDLFQEAGKPAPFSMISESAEMPSEIEFSDTDDKIQLNLFEEE